MSFRLRGCHALLWFASVLACLAVAPRSSAGEGEAVWLPRAEGTALRVLVWNVWNRSFFERAEGFRQVLSAIDADLLLLDEMPPDIDASAIQEVLVEVPGNRPRWQVHYGVGGGAHQRASIAATGPTTRVEAFDALHYPADAIAQWTDKVRPQLAEPWLDSLRAGVAAVGAIVEVDDRRLLVVGLDMQCCGDGPESWQEARRRIEAALVRSAIDAVLAVNPVDAVLVGGDLNTVNGPRPLEILRGDGSDITALADVHMTHRYSEETWTWDGRGTPYPNGRLDFVLHSPALLPLQAQIFDSEGLTEDEAAALGLSSELSRSLSDHRPLVVDFGWR
jgi:hypothetical protein